MWSWAPTVLVSFVLILATWAGCILGFDPGSSNAHEVRSREFQQLVGGLGFGPSTELSRCPFAFDPRLGPRCQQDTGPIPGGACFCPHHACSVFEYQPLDPPGVGP